MRILITGGRNFSDRILMWTALDRLHAKHCFMLLIHGNAKGADRLASMWAQERGVGTLAYSANWARYGRSAGPIRNRQMLGEKPDLVVAFPGGRGTADMVQVAKEAGLQVVVV